MKARALSVSTILGFIGLMLMIHMMNAHASTNISCKTAFGEKNFTIVDDRISFTKQDESGVSRSISSVASEAVRTHKKNTGFSKTLYIDGLKHKINVENENSFSDVNDYLSITSPRGHEMTYPLNCHSV